MWCFQRIQQCVLCSGLSSSGFIFYIHALYVVDYRVWVSTSTFVHSMMWNVVNVFQRLRMNVRCSGLSCNDFNDYYSAFYVVYYRVGG